MRNVVQAEGNEWVCVEEPMCGKRSAIAAAHFLDAQPFDYTALHRFGHGG